MNEPLSHHAVRQAVTAAFGTPRTLDALADARARHEDRRRRRQRQPAVALATREDALREIAFRVAGVAGNPGNVQLWRDARNWLYSQMRADDARGPLEVSDSDLARAAAIASELTLKKRP